MTPTAHEHIPSFLVKTKTTKRFISS